MSGNYFIKQEKDGKRKVHTAEYYRFITTVKTVGVIAAAIIVVLLFCGSAFNEYVTPDVLSVTGIVTSAVVVIAFGTYLLLEKPSDPESRKENGKRK